MGKQKLTIQALTALTFTSEVAKSLSLNIMNRHFKHIPNVEKLKIIADVLERPEAYTGHSMLGLLAHKLV